MRLNAMDVALSLRGPGEAIDGGTVPDRQVALVITQGTEEVVVVGRLMDIHNLVHTGLSMPVTEQILHDYMDTLEEHVSGE